MPQAGTTASGATVLAGNTGTPTTNQQATNYTWAQTVLVDAGLPTTPNNVSNIARWMTHENAATNWYNRNNPLNASLGTSEADGTGSYPSLTVAAQQTAAMIRQQNMAPIYNALAANAPPATFSAAVTVSPWASSHYGVAASGAPAKYVVTGRLASFMADGPNPPVVAATGAVVQAASGGSGNGTGNAGPAVDGAGATNAAGMCSNSGGVDLLGLHLGTGCQLKALTGGLLIGLGGFVAVAGALLIASRGLAGTAVGRQATQAARAVPGPAGKVVAAAGAVGSRANNARPSKRRAAQDKEDAERGEADAAAERARQRLARRQEMVREQREHKGRAVPASASGPAF